MPYFLIPFIESSNPDYELRRAVWNARVQCHPAFIAYPQTSSQVSQLVQLAQPDLPITVRGAGHSLLGSCVCDHALVIDLSRMKGIRVDSAARAVRVEAGCVWGDVDHATHAFGMAAPCGFISTTGVAGLTRLIPAPVAS